ncbi:contact-dependent growth inhibition system immunity protein [Pantoea allii]|uniref:contact-dependent growth inhibition system immunity protein n=1 Tax=Pantoea allii TaxID=574096 RepID=UPI003977ADAF
MKYPIIKEMLTVYFCRYHDDFGTSLDEIASYYFDTRVLSRIDARNEIASLLNISDDAELQATLKQLAGDRFEPDTWGETWRSFLETLQQNFNRLQ